MKELSTGVLKLLFLLYLKIICRSEVFCDKEVVFSVSFEAGGEDDWDGEVHLLVFIELLAKELLQTRLK